MRLRFLAAAVLLGSLACISRADYVVIRINLQQTEDDPKNAAKQPNPPKQAPGPTRQPGQPRSPGQPLTQPNDPTAKPPALHDGDYVMAVVELKGAPQRFRIGGLDERPVYLEHKWGKTGFFHEDREIQLQLIKPDQLKTPLAQYAERRKAIVGDDQRAERILDLAKWCLEVGLPDKCMVEMDRIADLIAKGAKPAAQVVRATEAYKLVKPIIADEVPRQEKALLWKQKKLHYPSIATSKHYALVHSADDAARSGIQRRLEALEANFKTFYLLFAIKGKALPAPVEKLPAILVADMGAFNKVRQTFEFDDLVSDGFHARQDNLAVFAPVRIDEPSGRFNQEMRSIYQRYQVDLLKGQFPNFGKSPENLQEKVFQAARAQIFALVEAAMQEEAEVAAATHEGSRQLLASTGLLPNNGPAPEWLRFGLASLFDMPKGPFPGNSTSIIRMSFWTCAGGANWEWRRYFDEMIQDHSIGEQPTEQLWETLNDVEFHRAHALFAKARDEAAKPVEPGASSPFDQAQVDLTRGRCLSWALAYYLFSERFDELMTLLDNLANQPRDVDFDPYQFLSTFCSIFHVDGKGMTPANLKGNLLAYDDLARTWVKDIKRVALPAVPLTLADPNGEPAPVVVPKKSVRPNPVN